MTAVRSSIALRLAIGLSAGTAILWIGAAAIAAGVLQKEINQALDDTLRQSAFRLLPLAIHEIDEGEDPRERRVGVLREDDEYLTYFVRDPAGAIVVRAEDAGDLPATGIRDGFSEIDGRRLFATTDPRSGYGIVVIERTDHRRTALADSLAALTWPLLGLIPLIAGGIWLAIRLAMRPVERLSREIASRDSRNLSPLNSAGHPVELAPIAREVESLLKRLGAALDAERAFAASSAHELRTPIAGALAQAQQLAVDLAGRPGAERIGEIEASLKHLAQLSEKLLQLSRLDAGFARSDVEADLLPALRLVVRDFQGSAAAATRVKLEIAEGTVLRARINLDAFAIAIRNIIENALVHGSPTDPVLVQTGPGRQLRIVNSGPLVPPDVLVQLAKPFARGDTVAPGTGLGLSIVRSILDQIGGTLTLHSPAVGALAGFEAVVALPA